MRSAPLACSWLAWLLYSAPAVAVPEMTPFEAGVRAYRSGDFATALRHFQQAQADGASNDQLLFNLALTLYRLEQYDAARDMFLDLREHSGMEGPADYHLGLIAAQRSDNNEAVLRLSAVANSDSSELRQLAQTALERMQGSQPAPRIAAYARTGLGFDSNRNQISESLRIEGPEAESAYADFYGSVLQRLRSTGGSGSVGRTDVRASLFVRDYEVDDALDQAAISLALRKVWRVRSWSVTLGGEFEAATLDNHGLYELLSLNIDAARRMGSSTFRLRYRPSIIDAGYRYDYLDGQRQQLELTQDVPLGAATLQLGYEVELNDRRDFEAGDEFFSQSPLRQGPFFRFSRELNKDLSLDVNAAYRRSRYRDENEFEQDGSLVTERRVDSLSYVGLMLRLTLAPAWALRLDYRYSDNRSSLDQYDYIREVASLNLEWRH